MQTTHGIPWEYRLWLAVFTLLFIGRVAGQMLVAFLGVTWLPPMQRWHSGLLAYPILLPIQVAIVAGMAKVVLDFARGQGYFVSPHPRAARFIKWFSILYFLAMVARYSLVMWLRPEDRWFTGTLPIWFHMVLAAFLYTYSHYHLHRAGSGGSRP
jgi:hypothetical protein